MRKYDRREAVRIGFLGFSSLFVPSVLEAIARPSGILSMSRNSQETLSQSIPNVQTLDSAIGESDEIVTHIDGHVWSWRGIVNGDYFPRSDSFFSDSSRRELTRNFGFKTGDLLSFGSFVETVDQSQIDALVEKYSSRIDIKLHDSVRNVIKDRNVYTLLEHFLRQGGKIEVWPDKGLYKRRPLRLYIGIGEERGPESVLVHESLHYFFDRIKLKRNDNEHDIINPLEQKYIIISSFRNGTIPLSDTLPLSTSLYSFTTDGKIGQKIKGLLRANNAENLEAFIESEDFYRGYVRSSILSILISVEYARQHPKDARYAKQVPTLSQIRDIAFMYAINAFIIKQAFRLVIDIHRRQGLSTEESFRTQEFQYGFNEFISGYVGRLSQDSSLQPGNYSRIQDVR